MSEEGPTATPEQVSDPSISPTGTNEEPPVIRLSDILVEQTSILEREGNDRTKLNALVTPDLISIRAKLIAWASRGFPSNCDLVVFSMTPPNPCSDGASRNIYQYIEFLSGKTIEQHLGPIQAMLPDFVAAYYYDGTAMRVGVAKP